MREVRADFGLVRLAPLALKLLRLVGIVGLLCVIAEVPLETVRLAWRDRGCVTTVAQRLSLPAPDRLVEVQIHRCPTSARDRPKERWQAWAIARESDDRRLLIELKHNAATPPTARWDAEHGAVIEGFRWSDVLDWQRGRGLGYVPTQFRFIDDNGVEPVVRRLP